MAIEQGPRADYYRSRPPLSRLAMRTSRILRAVLATVPLVVSPALGAQESTAASTSSPICQSLDDAWWTGPMLAAGAGSLPRGHFLIEPYLYDVHSGQAHGLGSLTYVLYGLSNRVTVGMIPTVGFNAIPGGTSSSGIGMGDVAATAQLGLTRFRQGSWIPTTSLVVQETFPTGKYDQLGSRPSDGLGGGAYTTTVALYAQTYFWLHNGRILRTRLDVSQSFSNSVSVRDVSVYGTSDGFRGRAQPGSSMLVDASWEYSMTRSWVLALDVMYRHGGSTTVSGTNELRSQGTPVPPPIIDTRSGTSDAVGFAPGVEYSWKPWIGVLLAARVIPSGHNTASSITPAIAVNIVR